MSSTDALAATPAAPRATFPSAPIAPTAPDSVVPSSTASTVILAVAAFVIVTTEFLIVGLLPALARDLGISISTAGQLVTLFAVVVMLIGPVLTAWLSHLERKRLFVAILLIFAAANLLAAVAPNVGVLALARFIPALALPVFWGTASETAAQLAGPAHAGRAVSRVYLGISAAMLFGIPLGTLAADAIGWRGAFGLLAALSLGVAVTMQWRMPTLRKPQRLRLAEQARILRDPFFVANVALSVLVFTAMFTAYTYLAVVLERVAGVPAAQLGWWLMGFGAVGLVGNWLGGRWVDRHPLATTGAFCAVLAAGMAAAMWAAVGAADARGWLIAALAVWGVANTALYPVCQIRVMKAASQAQALAGTLNVSAANAGIAFGAVLGGLAIPAFGAGSVGYAAAAVALLAVAAVPLVVWLGRRRVRAVSAGASAMWAS